MLGFVLRRSHSFTNVGAVAALYNAFVRSSLECNAVIWAPHEAKCQLMVERIQNKFISFLYLRQYGVYPFYPLMYPTLFVLGMVGNNELQVRRKLCLVTYLFRLVRGKAYNSEVLSCVSLYVPDRYVWRRRRPRLLAERRRRTNLLGKAPLTRAVRTLNIVAENIDLFWCSLTEFTKSTLFTICYMRHKLE
jgi:hypothetical protein